MFCKRSVFAWAFLTLVPTLLLLGGCGKKEEAPPSSAQYYTGPKTPKGGANTDTVGTKK